MPAFDAVRFNEPTCQALYERVYQRTGIKMKAYVAVQKRLLLMATPYGVTGPIVTLSS